MRYKIFSIIIITSLFSFATAHAQTVKGTVRDAKTAEPIPGANVVWIGTQIGTSTDADGNFALGKKSPDNQTLVISCIGYINDTIETHPGLTVQAKLKPAAITLTSVEIKHRQKGRLQKLSTVEQTEAISLEGLRGLACCNLGESFENSVSVDVGYSDAVSGSKQIQLLGLTGSYSQMLLENTPFLRGLSAPFGLGYVPGQWMEGISVSKGVATVKNGYEAITGTINLDYEKPQKGDMFSLNLYENSDLKSEITAKFNHQFNEKLSTGLYIFGTINSHRTDHLGHDSFIDVPLQKQLNLVNRWTYEKSNGLCSQTLVNYTHEERLGGQIDFEKTLRGNDSIYGFGGNTDRIHFFTKNGFALSKKSSFGSQITGTYFQQDAFYGLTNYNAREADLYGNFLINCGVFGTDDVDYGISFRYSNSRESLRSIPYLGAAPQHPLLEIDEFVPGIFGQYTFRWGDAFTATGGLRYDYNTHFHEHIVTPRVHFRWKLGSKLILRGVAGTGARTTNIIAENIGLLASSRDILLQEPLRMERARNIGINLTKTWTIWNDREMSFTLDYYRTDFTNQVVVDLDQDANKAVIYNLNGKSYSNVAQADFNINIFEGFDLSLAGKINDVMCTYNGQLLHKPYTSKYKGLIVMTYHTKYDKWRFDLTTQSNGPQRLPLNNGSLNGEAPAYIYMLGQVTRKFKRFEVYVGCENITNHTQDCPVIGADAPFTQAFDASVVYAPLMGRLFYGGLRFNIR